jgi:regulator of protease activity HflC (stomatin/prohibitin superfamily)
MLMWLIITLVILFICLVVASVEIVSENTVYVVEFFGKFSRIMRAGLNFRVPLLEHVVEEVTLKQQNFTLTDRYNTKDKLVIDVSANIIFSVIPTPDGVKKYTYTLQNREKTIATTIENALRLSIAARAYDDVLAKKEAITRDVWEDLRSNFSEWGVEINNFQIVSVRLVNAF